MSKMEVIDFYPSAYGDVPVRDCPAYNRFDEVLLIVGSTKHEGNALLLHIIPNSMEPMEPTVVPIGSFFDHKVAVSIAHHFEYSLGQITAEEDKERGVQDGPT